MKKAICALSSAVFLLSFSGCAFRDNEASNIGSQVFTTISQRDEPTSEPIIIDSLDNCTDFETIVNANDLPKYCGSLKEAKDFGKRFEKSIVSTEDYDFKSNITILSIDGYWKDDKISGVELYFKNAAVSLNFQESEAVMNLFLPLGALEENYSEPNYENFTPIDESKSEYIAVTYLYKQDNLDASENGLHNNFYIMYELYNDVCLSASIDSRLPRWTSSANANGYNVSEYMPTNK